MHKFKLSIIFGAVLLLVSSCAEESLSPVLTFDKAGKGAYVRLIEETERGINLFDIPGSEYKYSVEFVDVDQGKQVSEYRLDLIYTDADKSDGDNSTGPVNFRTYTASDFETLQSGFIGMTDITVPATELISAAGLTPDQVNPGDRFRIESYVTLEDGSVFGYDNSTAAVNGSAFQGHFRYDLDAACQSSLEGSYEFQGSDFWCDEADAGGTVEVV